MFQVKPSSILHTFPYSTTIDSLVMDWILKEANMRVRGPVGKGISVE